MSKTPKDINTNTIIYTLAHPLTGEIRYVGKTVKSLNDRLKSHVWDTKRRNNHRVNWIKSLLKKNLQPTIESLDECPWIESQQLEQYWISQFKQWNFRLLNMTDGGEGNLGAIKSEETKIKLKQSIRSNSKVVYQYTLQGEFIKEYNSPMDAAEELGFNNANICQCCNGKKKSHAGFMWSYTFSERLDSYNFDYRKVVTEQSRINRSNARKGYKPTEEHKRNMAIASTKRWENKINIDNCIKNLNYMKNRINGNA